MTSSSKQASARYARKMVTATRGRTYQATGLGYVLLCAVCWLLSADLVDGSAEFECDEFFLVEEKATFDDAILVCEANRAALARIQISEENQIVRNLIEEANTENSDRFYIGLRDLGSDLEGTNPARFDFIDGLGGDKAFFLQPAEFPWDQRTNDTGGSNEPNNAGGIEDCVAIEASRLRWQDRSCSQLQKFVCRRDCTTALPTKAPTFTPTSNPTDSTNLPTISPSTSSPSTTPTMSPVPPTVKPDPTAFPTQDPTKSTVSKSRPESTTTALTASFIGAGILGVFAGVYFLVKTSTRKDEQDTASVKQYIVKTTKRKKTKKKNVPTEKISV